MRLVDEKATVKWGFEPHESNRLALGKAISPTITNRDASLLVAPFTVNSIIIDVCQPWQHAQEANNAE